MAIMVAIAFVVPTNSYGSPLRHLEVERESLEFVFPMAAEGAARLKCHARQAESNAQMPLLTCRKCGSDGVEGGRDLFIKSVELETA